jgi:N-methylhydantoinase B
MQVSEALAVAGEGAERHFECLRCGGSLGAAAANYKLSAKIEEAPLSDANRYIGDPARYVDEEMVFRRFFCPGCGVLLDTEVARLRDEPLWDIELA